MRNPKGSLVVLHHDHFAEGVGHELLQARVSSLLQSDELQDASRSLRILRDLLKLNLIEHLKRMNVDDTTLDFFVEL